MRSKRALSTLLIIAAGLLLITVRTPWASAPESFRFAILGDRTGEAQPGVYQQIWRDIANEQPAFVLSVGDTIQGLDDQAAATEWREIEDLLKPFRRFPLYLAPGNHDIWSPLSKRLFRQHTRHALHYSFDYGAAHFTILDNSRSDALPGDELAFLRDDLQAHASQPIKVIVSHRPFWLLNVAFQNSQFAFHQLAHRYGVNYVVAGHVHQMLHFELQGVTYLSMPSSGGHLRSSGAYADGWFFGYAVIAVNPNGVNFQIKEVGRPWGEQRVTKLADWGILGLVRKQQPDSVPTQ